MLTPYGDILQSESEKLTQQSIIRRLLTNPGTYFWHPEYGAGIGRFVGESLSSDNFDYIKNIINSNILLEENVAQTPSPQISFIAISPDILQCTIVYYSIPSQTPATISFQVS
jgi:hypothetical protein